MQESTFCKNQYTFLLKLYVLNYGKISRKLELVHKISNRNGVMLKSITFFVIGYGSLWLKWKLGQVGILSIIGSSAGEVIVFNGYATYLKTSQLVCCKK